MTELTRSLHSLSGSELSRLIAEKLEPIASIPLRSELWPKDAQSANMSPLGFWYLEQAWYHSADPNIATLEIAEAEPRDMVHDAQMTVLLLQQLLAIGVNLHNFDRPADSTVFLKVRIYLNADSATYPIEKLGRGIAESWMLAHGYKAT